MFLSGMNKRPVQRSAPAGVTSVRSWVPTSSLVALAASFLALSLAQATVQHQAAPHGARLMMLLPPGLRQCPSKGAEGAAWKANSKATAATGIDDLRSVRIDS